MSTITWRETVTSGDGTTSTGHITEGQALAVLYRGVRLGYPVDVTRNGGAVITRWYIPTGLAVRQRHTVTLEPDSSPGPLSDGNVRDLAGIIAGRAVSPASAARLAARGLLVPGAGQGTVTLTARLAMLAAAHRTRPGGCCCSPVPASGGPGDGRDEARVHRQEQAAALIRSLAATPSAP